MNVTPHFSKLQPGDVNFLVPPNAQRLISGVSHAYQTRGGVIVLVYVDKTTAERHSNLDLIRQFDDFFSVVRYVQGN